MRARLASLWPLAAALVFTALPFYRVLFFEDRALLYRDIYRHFLVGKAIWANAVRAGEGIPYWNSFSFGGMRFWAENVNSPLHPLNFLFLLFSPENYALAMNYYVWIHYPVIFGGAFMLCRVLRLRRAPACLFATSLALSGVAVSAHNVTHSLAAFACVPWFLAFWLKHLRGRGTLSLFGASFALAWPIFGGDPQIAYVLSFVAAGMAAWSGRGSRKERFCSLVLLGLLALIAAGAQLLPTMEFILDSGRSFGAMKRHELLAFSFHPIRLLETIWPQFFGNRFGPDPFWGQNYVNFIYKTPFIFSTYAGTLTVLLAVWSLLLPRGNGRKRRASPALFLAFFVFGLILCFGEFSLIPLYDLFLSALPLFGAFRYPERLLFWPFLSLWLAAVLAYPRLALAFRSSRIRQRCLWVLGGMACVYAIALIFLATGIIELPPSSLHAVFSASVSLAVFGVIFILHWKGALSATALSLCLLAAQAMELGAVQTFLVWDQSKYLTDVRRYPLALQIRQELADRESDFRAGAARRFDSFSLTAYQFLPGEMDHSTLSTFSGFEALASNLPGMYGVDDIGGYFALVSREKSDFWAALRETRNFQFDNSRLLELTGTYFLPSRGKGQEPVIRKNERALPYLFFAKEVEASDGFNESIQSLRRPGHDFHQVTVVAGADWQIESPLVGGTLSLQHRNGREMLLALRRNDASRPSFLVWNESYDRHWKAYVNGVKVPVYRANAWAMGVFLPPNEKSEAEVRFAYENPLITLGVSLTALWGLLFAAALIRAKAIDRSGAAFPARREGEARA